jgi:hypothetical protein
MNDLSPKRTDKFKAYRARKKAAGLREVRMWVPDFDAPGFQEELDREIEAINRSRDSKRVLAQIERAAAEVWNDIA